MTDYPASVVLGSHIVDLLEDKPPETVIVAMALALGKLSDSQAHRDDLVDMVNINVRRVWRELDEESN